MRLSLNESPEMLNTVMYSLAACTSADAFNPLKVNLFYKDFNTIAILDNRLAEVFKVDFNSQQPLRLITHVSTAQ